MRTETLKPQVLHDGEGDATWFIGTLMTRKAGDRETNGSFALLDQLAPAGFAPPLHIHHAEDEAFYILSGEVDFYSDGQRFEGHPGSWIFLPRGISHAFKVRGDGPARLLTFTFPAGFERFVSDLGTPAPQQTLPPSEPPDVEKIASVAARYRIEIVGPPPD